MRVLYGIRLHKKNVDKLEMVQRRALRFVFNKFGRNHSPSKLMCQTDLIQLQTRRKIARLKTLFQIINHSIKIPHDKYVTFATRTNTRFTHSKTIIEHRSRIDSFKYSFFPRTTSEWNKLPKHVVDCDNVSLFLSQLAPYV